MSPTETFVSIQVVSRLYGVDLAWLRQAAQVGLLHSLQQRADVWQLATTELDRLASAVRWNRHLGVELDLIAALFDERPLT